MAPKRSPTTTGLGRGKRAKNNIVCIVGLKNRPDLNGRYGTVIDHDKRTDRYTVKVSGKKNEEEESVLVKSENVTNVDSKRAIQARKKGQFNTLEKLFAKKTGGQEQTEEEDGGKNIFVSPKEVKVKKEEHKRTDDDTDDDDDDDKREQQQKTSARERNNNNGITRETQFLLLRFIISSYQTVPQFRPERLVVSLSVPKKRGERERKEGGPTHTQKKRII